MVSLFYISFIEPTKGLIGVLFKLFLNNGAFLERAGLTPKLDLLKLGKFEPNNESPPDAAALVLENPPYFYGGA